MPLLANFVKQNNTFQCVLAWNDTISFAIFLYVQDLQWTTGDVNGGNNGLGGNEAQVGFDSGNGSHFSLPVSGTPDVLQLDTLSNVNRPGIWAFRIDGTDSIINGTSESFPRGCKLKLIITI